MFFFHGAIDYLLPFWVPPSREIKSQFHLGEMIQFDFRMFFNWVDQPPTIVGCFFVLFARRINPNILEDEFIFCHGNLRAPPPPNSRIIKGQWWWTTPQEVNKALFLGGVGIGGGVDPLIRIILTDTFDGRNPARVEKKRYNCK